MQINKEDELILFQNNPTRYALCTLRYFVMANFFREDTKDQYSKKLSC